MKRYFENPFFKFIIIFSGLAILWFSFYHNIYKLDQLFLPDSNHFNIQTTISIRLAEYANIFVSIYGVWIGEPCNGVKLFGLFTLFILAFPGSWKKKLWFIPLGIFIVHTANAIRIALLTIISAENPKALDFNHNITFQVIIYGLIFLLWYWWVQKLSGIIKPNEEI